MTIIAIFVDNRKFVYTNRKRGESSWIGYRVAYQEFRRKMVRTFYPSFKLCESWGGGGGGGGQKRLRALKYGSSHIFTFQQNYTSFNAWVRYFVWNFKGYLWNSAQNIPPYIDIERYDFDTMLKFEELSDLRARMCFWKSLFCSIVSSEFWLHIKCFTDPKC